MKLQLEWKKQDCWIGVYWKRSVSTLHLWICVLPCLPLHLQWGSSLQDQQERYEKLSRKFIESKDGLSDHEQDEMTRLFYELYPEEIFWTDGRTPQDIWGKPSLVRWVKRTLKNIRMNWHYDWN
jgi:hypothetical protein